MTYQDQKRRDYGWLAGALKDWFPWLGTDDPAEGADTIAILADLYQHALSESNPDYPTTHSGATDRLIEQVAPVVERAFPVRPADEEREAEAER